MVRNEPVLVPRVGLEPTLCHHNRILSPARLPIPPPRQGAGIIARKIDRSGVEVEPV